MKMFSSDHFLWIPPQHLNPLTTSLVLLLKAMNQSSKSAAGPLKQKEFSLFHMSSPCLFSYSFTLAEVIGIPEFSSHFHLRGSWVAVGCVASCLVSSFFCLEHRHLVNLSLTAHIVTTLLHNPCFRPNFVHASVSTSVIFTWCFRSSMYMLSVCIDFLYLPVYLCKNYDLGKCWPKNDCLGKWWLAVCMCCTQSCIFICISLFWKCVVPVNESTI